MDGQVGPPSLNPGDGVKRPQPQPSDWRSRNWKWVVPVVYAVGAMSIIATIVFFLSFGVIFSLVFHAMKTSGGYQEALAAARANHAVVLALGSPIKDGLLSAGEVSATYSDLEIPIHGPKGKGTLYVSATKSLG